MLIFTNGSTRSIRRLKQLLIVYEKAPGQKINFEKSGFYPSTKIQGRQLHKLERKSGCIARKLPFMYLGAPLFKGRCKAIYFDTLFQKFASCLDGWKTKFLSFAAHQISVGELAGSYIILPSDS